MDPKRFVIVQNNEVINSVFWNGDASTWTPPLGALIMQDDFAGIGDWWEESEQRFYRPLPKKQDQSNIIANGESIDN